MLTSSTSVNLGAVVGGACGGLAVFIAIITVIIFLRKAKSRQVKLEESRRPDPFPTIPASVYDQIASLPVRPAMDEKTRRRFAARGAAVYQARRQSDGELSTFHFVPASGNVGRALDGEASGPSSTDHFSHDFVIDCRREDSFRSSVVRDTPPPTAMVGSSPPGYQTVETLNASNPPL